LPVHVSRGSPQLRTQKWCVCSYQVT
jgi:hypothetical protein